MQIVALANLRKNQHLTLQEHAELATELNRFEDLISAWVCSNGDGGILCNKMKINAPIVKKLTRMRHIILSVKCQLDTLWCEDTPRTSGFPYYDSGSLQGLCDAVEYKQPVKTQALDIKPNPSTYASTHTAVTSMLKGEVIPHL